MPYSESLSHHFKKRKAPISPINMGGMKRPPTILTPPIEETLNNSTINEGDAHLTVALRALKVSLRDMRTLVPPTPAASPVHSRPTKRLHCDVGNNTCIQDDMHTSSDECQGHGVPKSSPIYKKRSRTTSFLTLNSKLKMELDGRIRKNTRRLHRSKRRQQLSYFAIASAFHQAARETS